MVQVLNIAILLLVSPDVVIWRFNVDVTVQVTIIPSYQLSMSVLSISFNIAQIV